MKLSTEEMLDWLEGRLAGPSADAVEAALATADPETRREADWYRALLDAGRTVIMRSAPADLADVVSRRYEAYRQAMKREGLRIVLATIRLDSAGRLGAVGVRSGGSSVHPRHLLYSTDVADIALDIHGRMADTSLDIMGQLFPTPAVARERFSVQLLRGSDEIGESRTDDLGEFGFNDISPGDYQFFLTSGSLGILLTPVPLGL